MYSKKYIYVVVLLLSYASVTCTMQNSTQKSEKPEVKYSLMQSISSELKEAVKHILYTIRHSFKSLRQTHKIEKQTTQKSV